MDQPVLSFRSSFWVSLRWVMSYIGVLTLVIMGAAYFSGWEWKLPSPVMTLAWAHDMVCAQPVRR